MARHKPSGNKNKMHRRNGTPADRARAFEVYYGLGVQRSVNKVATLLQPDMSRATINRWAKEDNWVEKAKTWDSQIDDKIVAAGDRHRLPEPDERNPMAARLEETGVMLSTFDVAERTLGGMLIHMSHFFDGLFERSTVTGKYKTHIPIDNVEQLKLLAESIQIVSGAYKDVVEVHQRTSNANAENTKRELLQTIIAQDPKLAISLLRGSDAEVVDSTPLAPEPPNG